MLILYTPTYRELKRGTKGINEGFGGTRGGDRGQLVTLFAFV